MARTWRIGEVAERTGLTRRTLRHYDELGLLVPSARSWGDYRLYDETDLLRLLQIQNLKALGLSLGEITTALAEPSLDAAATLGSHLAHLEEQIAAEQQLANRLRSLAEADQRSWEDVLDAIALTRRQSHRDPIVRLRAALDPGQRTTAELFAALAAEADPAVQEVLVWALAQRPEAADLATTELPSAEPALRPALARLLGKTGDATRAAVLIGLLDDPAAAVVAAAVAALSQLAEPSAGAPLAALLGTGRVADAALIDALARLGSAAIEPTAERLRTGPDSARAAAAELLGRLGGSVGSEFGALTPSLTAALADPTPEVRLAALLALAEQGEDGLAAIESMATDPQLGPVAKRLLELHAR